MLLRHAARGRLTFLWILSAPSRRPPLVGRLLFLTVCDPKSIQAVLGIQLQSSLIPIRHLLGILLEVSSLEGLPKGHRLDPGRRRVLFQQHKVFLPEIVDGR